jgi:hypothetical protein
VGDWLEDVRARTWLHVTDVAHSKLANYAFIDVSYETELAYRRQEAASLQLVAMLDDIADAIWTLSHKKMPPERKNKAQSMVDELRGDSAESVYRSPWRRSSRGRLLRTSWRAASYTRGAPCYILVAPPAPGTAGQQVGIAVANLALCAWHTVVSNINTTQQLASLCSTTTCRGTGPGECSRSGSLLRCRTREPGPRHRRG